MTRASIHAQAARRPGALCGAEEGPLTRITTDPALVTCPDCDPVTAQIDALPDDAVAGDPAVIGMLRDVAAGAWRKIDGVVVDATTATAILSVYDALNDANKTRLAALRIDRMAQLAWKVVRPSGTDSPG